MCVSSDSVLMSVCVCVYSDSVLMSVCVCVSIVTLC